MQACATQQESSDSGGEDQREVMMVRRLNIKHSNYIWVNFTGTSLNVLTLIDSGAQVSVLPCKLYEKLPKEKQHPKSKSTVKIKAGNGTEIKCFGVAPVEFGFQGRHSFTICTLWKILCSLSWVMISCMTLVDQRYRRPKTQ